MKVSELIKELQAYVNNHDLEVEFLLPGNLEGDPVDFVILDPENNKIYLTVD